mmetsp:Transcript_51620/g.144240  ORF Transcript_51620/g.144240 Transcript_51620/m.144240 type:complete len:329 (+) Transcript_51620:212-1198(+)
MVQAWHRQTPSTILRASAAAPLGPPPRSELPLRPTRRRFADSPGRAVPSPFGSMALCCPPVPTPLQPMRFVVAPARPSREWSLLGQASPPSPSPPAQRPPPTPGVLLCSVADFTTARPTEDSTAAAAPTAVGVSPISVVNFATARPLDGSPDTIAALACVDRRSVADLAMAEDSPAQRAPKTDGILPRSAVDFEAARPNEELIAPGVRATAGVLLRSVVDLATIRASDKPPAEVAPTADAVLFRSVADFAKTRPPRPILAVWGPRALLSAAAAPRPRPPKAARRAFSAVQVATTAARLRAGAALPPFKDLRCWPVCEPSDGSQGCASS